MRQIKHIWKEILATSLLVTVILCFHFANFTKSTIIPISHKHAIKTSLRSILIPQPPSLRILPLGDSITYGYLSSTGNGYRNHLLELLDATFPSVTYIGSQHSGNMTNSANEGHPGFMIHDIAKKALPSLVQQPNVILLMAGTNDIARPYMAEDAPWRLGALIDFILLNCPFSTLIVAQLAPITAPPEAEDMIKIFNAQVPGMIMERQRAGKKILAVDMSQRFTIANLNDGVHPTDSGYEVIAETWYEGILQAVKLGLIWEPIETGYKGRPIQLNGPDGTEVPMRPIVEDGRICEICV